MLSLAHIRCKNNIPSDRQENSCLPLSFILCVDNRLSLEGAVILSTLLPQMTNLRLLYIGCTCKQVKGRLGLLLSMMRPRFERALSFYFVDVSRTRSLHSHWRCNLWIYIPSLAFLSFHNQTMGLVQKAAGMCFVRFKHCHSSCAWVSVEVRSVSVPSRISLPHARRVIASSGLAWGIEFCRNPLTSAARWL